MTKFKKFNKQDPPDNTVYFDLRETTFGDIELIAVDHNGERVCNGTVLAVNSEGVSVASDLNSNVPIKRGEHNRALVLGHVRTATARKKYEKELDTLRDLLSRAEEALEGYADHCNWLYNGYGHGRVWGEVGDGWTNAERVLSVIDNLKKKAGIK
jgi:hypothetical protein